MGLETSETAEWATTTRCRSSPPIGSQKTVDTSIAERDAMLLQETAAAVKGQWKLPNRHVVMMRQRDVATSTMTAMGRSLLQQHMPQENVPKSMAHKPQLGLFVTMNSVTTDSCHSVFQVILISDGNHAAATEDEDQF